MLLPNLAFIIRSQGEIWDGCIVCVWMMEQLPGAAPEGVKPGGREARSQPPAGWDSGLAALSQEDIGTRGGGSQGRELSRSHPLTTPGERPGGFQGKKEGSGGHNCPVDLDLVSGPQEGPKRNGQWLSGGKFGYSVRNVPTVVTFTGI